MARNPASWYLRILNACLRLFALLRPMPVLVAILFVAIVGIIVAGVLEPVGIRIDKAAIVWTSIAFGVLSRIPLPS